jgi:redox-sensing transcriptional repressor
MGFYAVNGSGRMEVVMEQDYEVKKISLAVIRRLPKYHKCLVELLKNNVERVSSQELSNLMGFTASQIRQDLNNFGEFGQQGYGYNVSQLYAEITKILGLDTTHTMIIIGAGNLGRALANYSGFKKEGFNIIAAFDSNTKLVGQKINDIPIYDVEDLVYFINNNGVDIAILTVTQDKADEIAKELYKTCIRGIWNFTPKDIKMDNDIVVENVNLKDSLFTLSYHINENRLFDRIKKRKKENVFKSR